MLSFNKKDKNKFIGVKLAPLHVFAGASISLTENTLEPFYQRKIEIKRQYISSPVGIGIGRGGSYG